MPFTKHVIQPINIAQCPIPNTERNELECLSNLTLANIIRQLSSLGEHADRVFSELIQDAVNIGIRTKNVTDKVENIRVKISHLDIQTEEVSSSDFYTKKHFKSSNKTDDQVVSRRTMSEAMQILYNNADPPPELDKLNEFRDDGKDCMKFYTDPDFFFNLWRNEMMKDNEEKLKNKKKKKKVNNKLDQKQQEIEQNQLNNEINAVAYYSQQQQQIIYNNNNNRNVNNYNAPQVQQVNRTLVFNNNNNGTTNQQHQYQQQQQQYSSAGYTDHLQGYTSQNYESRTIQSNVNERPTMRPPPVPKNTLGNHHSSNDSNGVQYYKEDLPPPPSPPHNDNNFQFHNLHKQSPPPPPPSYDHLVDELPPPPDDFVHDIKNFDVKRVTQQHINIPTPPPPPPAPPLPNFNTSIVQNNTNTKQQTNNSSQKNSIQNEFSNARNGVLDAIKNKQFNLRPIGDNDKKSIDPPPEPTSIAAILDSINQRRAHLAQSSDDDDDDDEQEWDN